MKCQKLWVHGFTGMFCAGILALAVGGCDTSPAKPSGPSVVPTKAGAETVAPVAAKLPTIRVKAGIDQPLTDSKGVVWAADTGFEKMTATSNTCRNNATSSPAPWAPP